MNANERGAARLDAPQVSIAAKRPRSLRFGSVSAAAIAATIAATPAMAFAADPQGPAAIADPQGPADPAQRAEDPTKVESIEVRAQRHPDANPLSDPEAPYKIDQLSSSKFTEPLINVPKTITVISKEVIADTGALTFRDLMRTQPGVTLGTGEGGNAFGDRFFIRGFDTRNDVYVDGVRDPGVTSREIFAIEQVEVLKGPSSTFGGRGTTGGAISIVSKQAMNRDFNIAHVWAGTEETFRAVIDTNHTFGDKLSLRLNLMGHTGGTAGRDYVFSNRYGAALAGRLQATDKLVLTADYYHTDDDDLPDWGVSYNLPANKPLLVNRDFFYGVTARDFHDGWADIYTTKAVYDYSDNLKVQTMFRFGQTQNAYIASAPEAPVVTNPDPLKWTLRANPKQRDQINTYWANQSDLTAKFDIGGFANTLVAGFEIDNEQVANKQYANLNAELGGGVVVAPTTIIQLVYAPTQQPWPFPRTQSAIRETEVDSQSFYFVDTIKLSDQWQVTGGLRHDTYDVHIQNTTKPANVITKLANKSDFTNWHAGVVFKPASNASIYFSAGTSSNPSGEQLDAAAADYGGLVAQNAALAAEENTAYELGAKWNVFDEHLNLTAAYFRVDKENARVQTGAGATLAITLSGDQRVEGYEFTVQGNVTPEWSLFGGYTHLEPEIINSPVASQIGLGFPNIAKDSFSMMSRYEINDSFYVGGLANYVAARYAGTVVALGPFIPSYWRGDVFAGYHVNSRMDVSVNVLNVTDETYFDALYRSATPFTYLAPGRSVLVKLDYNF